MLTIILVVVFLYAIPLLYAYKSTQWVYYHPEGMMYEMDPDGFEIFLVLCPVLNIIISIIHWGDGWKAERYKVKKPESLLHPKNFFKPTKPFS